jgi:transcriptional regulator with XRE-family HTH domain
MSNTIGEKFRLIRNTTGLSQPKFAALVDISPSSYRKYEGGFIEVGAQPILNVANHPDLKKYALWLVTGDTNPAAGQFAPGEESSNNHTLTDDEYEEKFLKVVADTLIMFCVLDWFTPNKEKGISFDDCAKLLFKDLKPVISERFKEADISQTKSA